MSFNFANNLRVGGFLVVSILGAFGFAQPAAAQSTATPGTTTQSLTASISGVVTDEDGAVLPGAWLTLADAAKGMQRTATTDERGAYLFGGLPAGRYVLSAGRDGFAPLRVGNLVLADGERRTVPVTLKLAPVTESVSVAADAGYTSGVTIGKRGQSLREIPQSVSVITPQRIQDQNLTDVTEALAQTTGITLTKAGDTVQTIYSRGFSVTSVQSDGGAPATFNTFSIHGLPDLAPYERVELLRGADGLFSGAGEAGGTINLVRKRPRGQNQVQVDLLAGSWDRYRAQFDATGPLGWQGRLRGRFVVAQENRNFFYDIAKDNKTILYGVVEADLTPRTLLTVGGSYDRRDALPFDTGLPRYASGADLQLPRETCFCARWSYYQTSTPEIFARVEQELSRTWTLKVNASYQRKTFDIKYTRPLGSVADTGLDGDFLWANYVHYPPRQTLFDATINGRFSLFGRSQDLVTGINRQHVDADDYYYGGMGYMVPIDPFNFNPDAPQYADPGTPPYHFYVMDKWGQRQTGLYSSLRSRITRSLHTIVGVRFSTFQTTVVNNNFDDMTGELLAAADSSYEAPDVWTPYAGVTYDVTSALSLYASYTDIFKPQGDSVTPEGEQLPAVTGASVELGAKGAWFGGALTGSLAAYRVQRKNAAVYLPEFTGQFGNYNCCYAATALIESKGFDVELTGQPHAGWQTFAGYTYNINRYEEGYGANNGTAYMPQTPKHLFKLWTMVQLPGAASAWRVGGGVNAQTRVTMTGTGIRYDPATGGILPERIPFVATQEAYAVVGLRGDYRINARWSAAVTVNNLFDRTYYQTLSNPVAGNFYGEPRNATVTLRVRY